MAELEPTEDHVVTETAAPEADTAQEPLALVDQPHPLETRLAALTALRAEAINWLPLLRGAQNADHRAPSALTSARDAVEAWRSDWQGALGLAGKRPKKVRPDPASLNQTRTVLSDSLTTAERELARLIGMPGQSIDPVSPVDKTWDGLAALTAKSSADAAATSITPSNWSAGTTARATAAAG